MQNGPAVLLCYVRISVVTVPTQRPVRKDSSGSFDGVPNFIQPGSTAFADSESICAFAAVVDSASMAAHRIDRMVPSFAVLTQS